ncbi:MAG: hypothetical protein K8R41_12325 [Bacteroidales bacterium]|nr:hypothetical protein [Bacteroidales bacterium]
MKIDNYYTLKEIKDSGLIEREVNNVDYQVFQRNGKVFFFEKKDKEKYRLYSKINKESFFL